MRLGYRVGAAAVRESLDDLAVGQDEGGEQDADRAGDRERVVEPGRAGRDQDDEDRFWP